MTALIFGANGQDGYYLSRLCAQRGVEPIGVSRSPGGDWRQGDVADREQVNVLVRDCQPSYIIHLAANSTTRHEALFENHATISTGALNVLEAAATFTPRARVFLAGSGVQFRNDGAPISEQTPFAATSAYAVARIQSVYAARYFRARGLRTYVGYLFHHESPRRGPRHVSQKVAQAVRRIAAGSGEMLELGDIQVRKEWMFAGDAATAIWTLLEQEAVFEAAIGSGVAFSIQEWVSQCFALVGLDWRDHVRLHTDFTPEYGCLVSDPSTMRSLGWRPTVGLRELAAMMVFPEGEDADAPRPEVAAAGLYHHA
jgi:GDPmannose 4,6-dehydratase